MPFSKYYYLLEKWGTILDKRPAQIFFLPNNKRPADLPALPDNMKGNYWHTGIIYEGKIYEAFGLSNNYRISDAEDPGNKARMGYAKMVSHNIDPVKLMDELKSGTDCATYVARVIGLDNKTHGDTKSEYFPEDILKYVENFINNVIVQS